MSIRSPTGLAWLLAVGCVACASQKLPPTWDGLDLVEKRGLDAVYVAPGASLAQYRRVMLDPVEVSFDKNWDPRQGMRLGDDTDPERIRRELAEEFRNVFREELETEGGYPIVTTSGDDVLRVSAAIVDLYINAPDTMQAGRSRTYVMDAGKMTLVAELRDSRTNALLARVLDGEQGSDAGGLQIANSVSNSAEARRAIAKWADALRTGLDRARTQAGAQEMRSASK